MSEQCPNCGYQLTPSNLTRAMRLPDDWKPSEVLRMWAKSTRPDVDLERELQLFVNYWTAKSGKDATKLDWGKTFKSWILRARGTLTPKRGGSEFKRDPNKKELTEEQRRANKERLANLLAGAFK